MAVGKSDTILVDGHNLADALQSVAPTAEAEELDATVLNSTYRRFEQGFRTGSVDLNGIFDSDTVNADEIHDILAAAYNTGNSKVVTISLGNYAVGVDVVMLDGCVVGYAVPINIGGLILSNANVRSNNGIAFGKWLVSSQLNAGTTNGTAVDHGAATSGGGVFHVHLHNDTATDVDVKLQHSTDNSVWADVSGAAVNNLSAAHTAGSATVTGTINRYIRAVAVVTGGNTTLVSAAFARR